MAHPRYDSLSDICSVHFLVKICEPPWCKLSHFLSKPSVTLTHCANASMSTPLSKLPAELWLMVMDNLPLHILCSWSACSSSCRRRIKTYIKGRRDAILAKFFLKINKFLDIQHRFNIVIANSAALKLVLAANDPAGVNSNNLDLYTSSRGCEDLVAFLIEEGLLDAPWIDSHSSSSVARTKSMSLPRSHLVVNVTEARQETLMPLFHSHSTLAMNFVAYAGVFSAYPVLSAEHKALLNPLMWYKKICPLTSLLALAKYTSRGFDIQSTGHSQWATHLCHLSVQCPLRIRSTTDRACMRFSFEEFPDRSGWKFLSSDNSHAIIWCLGGTNCESGGDAVRPMVVAS